MALNETHDPQLRSWVAAANAPGADFTLQNLPLGIFRRAGSSEAFRGGVAIGDQILDLAAALRAGVMDAPGVHATAMEAARAAAQPVLNELMAAGPAAWSALRLALSRALRAGSPHQAALQSCLLPQVQAQFALPAHIGDYTDFYTSIYHATAVGKLFRPDNPLLPNYKWMPIAYHGRCSSIAISGQQFHRPSGQILAAGATTPIVAPSQRLDYELELGVFIGRGNALGTPIAIDNAESNVFGLCLLNDWSARDLQAWEYQPLGPFLGKNFATPISPWIVTLEALAPFRVPFSRPDSDPQPLAYLDSPANREGGAIDIRLEALIQTAKMQDRGEPPQRLSETSLQHAYWSIAQLVAHHTVNGCNLRPGDLFGSGTQSGPPPAKAGPLVELSRGGTQALPIGQDEHRTFLEDGDMVIFRARCERPGAVSIGFGELRGRVLPASSP